MIKAPISLLRQIFSYNEETGVLTRLLTSSGKKYNRVVSCEDTGGYIVVGVNNRLFRAHRVIWAYYYGEWPAGDLDHINGKRNDNRIANLRLATPSQNLQNMKVHYNTKSGLKGAYFHKRSGLYQSMIRVDGKYKPLGYFETAQDAHNAYVAAAREHYGEFARAA